MSSETPEGLRGRRLQGDSWKPFSGRENAGERVGVGLTLVLDVKPWLHPVPASGVPDPPPDPFSGASGVCPLTKMTLPLQTGSTSLSLLD